MSGRRKTNGPTRAQIRAERALAREKHGLRIQMMAYRAATPAEIKQEWDSALSARFLAFPEVQEAKEVFCYLSCGSEISTEEIIRTLLSRGVRVACPRLNEDRTDMDFYWINGPEDSVPGYRSIPEPGPNCERAEAPDALVFVPGLAFTRAGDRLGYGGGFYDRFLEREPGHFTVALAYKFQLFDTLPTGAHDRRVAAVLTPEESIRCQGAEELPAGEQE